MAANGRLTNRQYVLLSDAISLHDMECIAQGYMNIDMPVIASIKQQNLLQAKACNNEMLQRWAKQNSNEYQTKISVV